MMHPVVGGCDQDVFKPAHIVDVFSMYKNPPDLGSRIDKDNIQRFKSQPGQGNEIQEAVEWLEDGRTEAYCKIQFF